MPYEEKDAGVAFVFCRNTGRILLERRSAHVNNPHTIGLFGGAREDTAESYGETATRELYEETGLNLKPTIPRLQIDNKLMQDRLVI